MAIKKTKRKAFNFLRSYFDVYNELQNDEDKLSFLESIINKQFLDLDPKDLNFISNLCYESQRHSIEKSVKGWKTANKQDLLGNPISSTTSPKGSPSTPPKGSPPKEEQEKGQEKEKEKVKDKKIYSDAVHDCFNFCLTKFNEDLKPKDLKVKNSWLDTIDKLNRIDGYDFKEIKSVVEKTRSNDFWCKNFLSLNKLRKKDKNEISYFLVFKNALGSSSSKGSLPTDNLVF